MSDIHDAYRWYQEQTEMTAVYPPERALEYLALGLAAEAGEVSGKVAKFFRGDGELDKGALGAELGDVLWFVAQLANELGLDYYQLHVDNLNKLLSRQRRGVLKGSGDER